MADEVSREAELERRIEELEKRLGRVDRRAVPTRSSAETAFWALMHRLFPEDARRHMKAATREQLLAARSYLDRWIDGLGEEPMAPAPENGKRERIEIE
jgi:type II secretory pathway component PulJ